MKYITFNVMNEVAIYRPIYVSLFIVVFLFPENKGQFSQHVMIKKSLFFSSERALYDFSQGH